VINNVQLLAARSGVMVRVVSASGPAVLGAGITMRRDITRSFGTAIHRKPQLGGSSHRAGRGRHRTAMIRPPSDSSSRSVSTDGSEATARQRRRLTACRRQRTHLPRIARGAREFLDVSVRSSPAWRVIDGGRYSKMHVGCCSTPSRLMGSIESSSLVRFPA
jgi:hypothetical protein